MAQEQPKRRTRREALAPGEDNIGSGRTRIQKNARGGYILYWRIRLLDGTVKDKQTKGKTRDGLIRKARETAAKILATSDDGAWSTASRMSRYCTDVTRPAIEQSTRLRPRSIERYLRGVDYYVAVIGAQTIAQAARPRSVEAALNEIAGAHGSSMAEQARKVLSGYVFKALVRDGVLDYNPLKQFTPEVAEVVKVDRSASGSALTEDEYHRCVDWLLTRDPADGWPSTKRAYKPRPDAIAKRAVALDLAATQATTGLRIAEGLALEKRDVGEDADGRVLITVRPEVSKTHRGRTVYVLDTRAAERVQARSAALSGPTDRIFDSPGGAAVPGADGRRHRERVAGREWNRENAQAAMRKLYDEMADACDVPLLHQVSTHVWRATLNTMWMEAKVPAEIRAAWFGHTEAVNVTAYMDVSDVAGVAKVIEAGKVKGKV